MSELSQLHDELASAIADLAAVTARDAPDEAALASVRYKLTRTSTARRRLVETLCAKFAPHVLPPQAEQLRALQGDTGALRANSSRHIADWSPRDIVKNWRGYCEASAVMRAGMLKQIEREKALLYPLLEGTP
jgi:hypothetical protein